MENRELYEIIQQFKTKLDFVNTLKLESRENSKKIAEYLRQEIRDPRSAIVQQQILGNEAKMLVLLEGGEQRLITFEIPQEDCTVQDLLEHANLHLSRQLRVIWMPVFEIDYIVDLTNEFDRFAD